MVEANFSSKQPRPDLPIVTIDMQSKHQEGCNCPLCGGNMINTTGNLEAWGGKIIVLAEAPAYHCDSCDFDNIDVHASIEFLGGAITRFKEAKDSIGLAGGIQQELRAGIRHQKLFAPQRTQLSQ